VSHMALRPRDESLVIHGWPLSTDMLIESLGQ